MTSDPTFANQSQYGLDRHGITNISGAYWNLSTALIYEQALRRHEGRLSHLGPLVVPTGQYTRRSPKASRRARGPGIG